MPSCHRDRSHGNIYLLGASTTQSGAAILAQTMWSLAQQQIAAPVNRGTSVFLFPTLSLSSSLLVS